LAVIPLYSEADILKVCPTKPSPAQSKAQRQASAQNPLRQHSEALRSLYGPLRHSCSLYVDDAGPSGLCAISSASAWLPLAQRLPLCLCAGLPTLSMPRTHCPSLQIDH